MKLLRPLARYTLHDHKTNDFIRRELKVTGILDRIDEYRLNWRLYLQRMSQNRIPLKSYDYRPQGRRKIGRPKKSWREQLLTLETERIKLVQSLMMLMMMRRITVFLCTSPYLQLHTPMTNVHFMFVIRRCTFGHFSSKVRCFILPYLY